MEWSRLLTVREPRQTDIRKKCRVYATQSDHLSFPSIVSSPLRRDFVQLHSIELMSVRPCSYWWYSPSGIASPIYLPIRSAADLPPGGRRHQTLRTTSYVGTTYPLPDLCSRPWKSSRARRHQPQTDRSCTSIPSIPLHSTQQLNYLRYLIDLIDLIDLGKVLR